MKKFAFCKFQAVINLLSIWGLFRLPIVKTCVRFIRIYFFIVRICIYTGSYCSDETQHCCNGSYYHNRLIIHKRYCHCYATSSKNASYGGRSVRFFFIFGISILLFCLIRARHTNALYFGMSKV